jgi:hypothetical protein
MAACVANRSTRWTPLCATPQNGWPERDIIGAVKPGKVALENELRIKVLSYFGIIITANLRYDESISKRVQFKQTTMFGLMLDMK